MCSLPHHQGEGAGSTIPSPALDTRNCGRFSLNLILEGEMGLSLIHSFAKEAGKSLDRNSLLRG